jgi:hypothetical protein
VACKNGETYLLKYVVEGKIEGKIEGTGGRGRRLQQLMDDVKLKTIRGCIQKFQY